MIFSVLKIVLPKHGSMIVNLSKCLRYKMTSNNQDEQINDHFGFMHAIVDVPCILDWIMGFNKDTCRCSMLSRSRTVIPEWKILREIEKQVVVSNNKNNSL